MRKLAKANATYKVTKPESKWRHLASGCLIIMSPLYKWLSQAMGGIQKCTSELYEREQLKNGVQKEDCALRCLIDSADEVKVRVEAMNDDPVVVSDKNRVMASRDMAQLFTNVDQEDVIQKVGKELFVEIWDMQLEKLNKDVSGTRSGQMRGRDSLRMVVHSKSSQHQTCIMGMEEIEKKGWKNCASRRIITLEMLQKWLELAIKHSYVRVGNDGVLKQEVGIPQGMNASPWISNLYLYMYELRFMRQFMEGTDADKAFFLENFKYCFRFQDDRWSGGNEVEKDAMYEEEAFGPGGKWHGLYPKRFLEITVEGMSAEETIHQDVRIQRKEWEDGTFHFTVGVYDRKYDDENLDKVRKYMVLYQRPTTMLTDQCIYGVVYSEMCRFSRRCSRLGDFMAASRRMVEKMIDMGYEADKINAKIKKVVTRVPRLYNCYARGKVQRPLMNVVRRAAERKAHRERGRKGRQATIQFLRELERDEERQVCDEDET